MSERRISPRIPTRRAARIDIKGMDPIECLVRDLSASGARLEVPDVRQLGNSFTLTIVGSWNRQACRVAWRKGNMVGVEYV
jgi:hypothetical protein